MTNNITINGTLIGKEFEPFVIVEIGINHEGDFNKAKKMVKDAAIAGAKCIKFQRHVIDDEMIPDAKNVIPGNAKESIWEIMEKCSLTLQDHEKLKAYVEKLGMIYLCTPFSRAAADELESINVSAYKIGSGECNNYPLLKHIASFGKPVILSTGMNDINNVKKSVNIFRKQGIEFALLHCTSMYPTPYDKVRLGALTELQSMFPNTVVGLSDHSIGNYTSFAAIPFGAAILEKHFTSDKTWPGPDIPISIDPCELKDLIIGSKAIYKALGGQKRMLKEEKITANFAYSSVVAIIDIKKGDVFSEKNIWVKRPGTGKISAEQYENILGKKARENIKKDKKLEWREISSD